MNPNHSSCLLAKSLRCALIAVAFAGLQAHAAPTLWTGTNVTYTQPAPGAADVLIPGKVSLARGSTGPLYNPAAGELSSDLVTSPKDTLWAFGELTNYARLSYVTFASLRGANANFNLSALITNKQMVVRLINEDVYLAVKFTYWVHGLHTGSGFGYVRSTPTLTAVPSVSITNPVAGAVFVAPATINLAANASVGLGTLTNVEYFAGATSLGSATVSPFNVAANIPVIGSYPLTAVASATGGAATSAVVNIIIANRPTVTLTNPVDGAVFAAPARLILSASAAVVGGTVTNVSFYRNNNLLFGSVTNPPFTFSRTAIPAASYAVTAVATASGLSATSSTVNITWVNAVGITSSPPVIANGQLSFSYTANPGLTYVVQNTSDLLTWSPVVTNVPSSSPVPFTESVNSNSGHFYRVVRILNP